MSGSRSLGWWPKTLFLLSLSGLAALAVSLVLYLLDLPTSGYLFLFGMITSLLSGILSVLRREGGAPISEAIPLLAGFAFFAWVAWQTLGK